jgi:hypothetical protein
VQLPIYPVNLALIVVFQNWVRIYGARRLPVTSRRNHKAPIAAAEANIRRFAITIAEPIAIRDRDTKERTARLEV